MDYLFPRVIHVSHNKLGASWGLAKIYPQNTVTNGLASISLHFPRSQGQFVNMKTSKLNFHLLIYLFPCKYSQLDSFLFFLFLKGLVFFLFLFFLPFVLLKLTKVPLLMFKEMIKVF